MVTILLRQGATGRTRARGQLRACGGGRGGEDTGRPHAYGAGLPVDKRPVQRWCVVIDGNYSHPYIYSTPILLSVVFLLLVWRFTLPLA